MMTLKLWGALAALAFVLPVTPAFAQAADTSQCAKVSPVTKSMDIPALQADADCFGAAAAADDAQADALRKAQAAAKASQKYRLDRIVAIKKLPPAAPPPPAAAPGWVDAPTLNGLADIPTTDFDPKTAVVPMPLPPVMTGDTVGAFRLICGPGQLLADDPVVYPGQPGKSHLHQFYGLLSVDAYSTYESMRHSKADSTCNHNPAGAGVFKVLNRSGYWMPAMLDGKGNVIRPAFVQIYYKGYPTGSPQCTDRSMSAGCVAIPNGIRFIFGRDTQHLSAPPTGNFHFACYTPSGNDVPNGTGPNRTGYPDMAQALAVCPAGNALFVTGDSPMCWDGKHVDSPNHRDHVAYPSFTAKGEACPADHPYFMPRFTMTSVYLVMAGDDTKLWRFSSDAMAPNEPAGSTYHADFFDAHDPGEKKTWTEKCIDGFLSSTSGNLCDGTGLPGAAWGNNPADPRLVPLASIPKTPVQP